MIRTLGDEIREENAIAAHKSAQRRVFIPTGTCYICDCILPQRRIMMGRPRSFFCKDAHQKTYAKIYPDRWADMKRQAKEKKKS